MRSFIMAIVFLVGVAGTSNAATFLWESSAAGCIPGDPAIQEDLYLVTSGSVSETGTGLVTLYCPVNPKLMITSGLNASILTLTYRLSNPTGSASITAQLWKQNSSTGALAAVTGLLAGTNGSNKVTLMFTYSFNFGNANEVYYVRVNLNRSSTSDITTLYGVALDHF
jgi:hypothetical protein